MHHRAPGRRASGLSGILNLQGVECLAELGQGFVSARISERMQTDQQSMIVRLGEDVGACHQHLADERSPVSPDACGPAHSHVKIPPL